MLVFRAPKPPNLHTYTHSQNASTLPDPVPHSSARWLLTLMEATIHLHCHPCKSGQSRKHCSTHVDILEFHRGKRCCEPWPAPEPKTNGFHKRRPTASFSLSAESVENVETSEAHLPRHRVLEKGSSRWMSTCYLRMEVKDGKDQALNFSFCIPNPPKKKESQRSA